MSFGIIKKVLKQSALWWAQDDYDEFGQLAFLDPVEIKCRWEDRAMNFIGANKLEQVSQSVVMVDRDIRPGDYLMQGTASETALTNLPKDFENAHLVKGFGKLPTIDAKKFVRTVYL